jgi:hypothetical protein
MSAKPPPPRQQQQLQQHHVPLQGAHAVIAKDPEIVPLKMNAQALEEAWRSSSAQAAGPQT